MIELLIVIGVLIVAMVVSCIGYDFVKSTRTITVNGAQYRYTLIGTDVPAVYHDALLTATGEMSRKELKQSTVDNAVYAWVRIGANAHSWREEPVNKILYLNMASDYDPLPQYLREENVLTRGQYRKKYGI